ncbi:alkanesulfonate monooxygenase SsuD/methylene tetrahydromethanopterin reductase-like flavin-dependent oxidoreductase (luciferase family) [Nocardiopsis metallicus]|uniref:Alkanesulfonate monooxygenase SsuD/methylene tetrahydromethanopterin reductase-like flavin-dependent oxidoreductase (Luciferase family) n=1 Tax=Nocardiopsis metallicus TaxID=179819 RepID=A0A840WKN7_9ACTN|nr:alkanesulfonate monooxygenase SsuD/methylene tetrahydromethanopterin reductase-like flavin-dependent oxidoreductase (luciferase family) [Nocardiopsis metallicus]
MSELTEPLTGPRFQVVLPDESPAMSPHTLVDLGVRAEELGAHTVWLPDHLLPPRPYGEAYGACTSPS